MRPGTKEKQRQSIENQTITDYFFLDPFWVFLTKSLRIFIMRPQDSNFELIIALIINISCYIMDIFDGKKFKNS